MSGAGRPITFQQIELYKIRDMETNRYFTIKELVDSIPVKTERRKSEVTYNFVTPLVIPTTVTNLINLVKSYTPASGTLSQFFNSTTDKFKPYNIGSTVTFKLNMEGTWSGGTTNRSMTLDFSGSAGNRLVESRDSSVSIDDLSFPTFFSVDAGGNLATNGSPITIQSNGGTFSCTKLILIAEQVVPIVTPIIIPD